MGHRGQSAVSRSDLALQQVAELFVEFAVDELAKVYEVYAEYIARFDAPTATSVESLSVFVNITTLRASPHLATMRIVAEASLLSDNSSAVQPK